MDSKRKYVNTAMAEVLNLVEHMGLNPVYLVVQGSTNYNLDVYSDEYMSDVDMKCFVLPTLKDLYYGNKLSKTYQTNYGQVEVKDLRLLPDLLGKMNSSYLELLYSPYYWVADEYEEAVDFLRDCADPLVRERFALLVKSMRGMALEKQNALCHEYEGLKDKLEKFGGYDPKQLHHAYRLLFMLDAMLNEDKSFGDAMVFDGAVRDFLMSVKVNGVGDKLTAEDMMENVMEQMQELYERVFDGKTPKSEYLVHGETLARVEAAVFDAVCSSFKE